MAHSACNKLAAFLEREEEEWKVSLSSFFVQPLPLPPPPSCPQERQKSHPLLFPSLRPSQAFLFNQPPFLPCGCHTGFPFLSPLPIFLIRLVSFPSCLFFCSGSAKDLKLSPLPTSPCPWATERVVVVFLLPLLHGFQKWFSRKPLSLSTCNMPGRIIFFSASGRGFGSCAREAYLISPGPL